MYVYTSCEIRKPLDLVNSVNMVFLCVSTYRISGYKYKNDTVGLYSTKIDKLETGLLPNLH